MAWTCWPRPSAWNWSLSGGRNAKAGETVASVFKRTRKKPIPAGAEIIERRGKRIAVWQSRGRKRRAEVTPDGAAVLIQDPNYTVSWFTWEGKRRKTNGGPDKDAAEALGTKLEADEMQRRRGLIDPRQERLAQEGRRTLEEHLTDFEAKMRAAGRDARHVARKAPRAAVFNMPAKRHSVPILLADLADARREWLKTVRHDPADSARRRETDFLQPVNHDGEVFDFHSLRHTCGVWLAMSGAHPKAVQSVMRHSTITLTMDTYGHLFPGQEAETVARFPRMLGDAPEALRATGTADAAASLGGASGGAVKRPNVA